MSETGVPKTGKAVVYDAPNTPFKIRSFPLRQVNDREVLVRVSMATVCRSDIHSYEGHRPNPCPGILGHEIIGVIEQIGSGIDLDMRGEPLAIGDRITWTEYFADGPSYYRDVHDMPQKAPHLRKYGHDLADDDPHFLGGFAEYCYILPGTGILKIPDAMTDEEATPLNCGVATIIAVTEAAEIGIGDTVVVQGLGLLGIYCCAVAKARGAVRVIGIDSVPDRLAMAKKFGADLTIDVGSMPEPDLVKMVRDASPPDGADVAIEVCGVASVIPTGVSMLRVGGRYVIAGLVSPDSSFTIDGNQLLKNWITLRGVHNYHPRHLIQALDFVMQNRDRFPFGDIVDARFNLDQVDEAFAQASSHQVLRAAIVP